MSNIEAPAGVTVRHEWGVHSTDGNVYTVIPPTEDKAVYEATLLYNGRPGSAEDTPEPGCAPASRYVMTTPQGEVATGWRWPCSWTPPPAVADRRSQGDARPNGGEPQGQPQPDPGARGTWGGLDPAASGELAEAVDRERHSPP